MLTSFHISGFRNIKQLAIPRLGRVNLIVGRNNVGKTTCLEAIRLYILGATPIALLSLLLSHDEISLNEQTDSDELRFESLFYGRDGWGARRPKFSLGPNEDESGLLEVSLALLKRNGSGESRYESHLDEVKDENDRFADVSAGLIVRHDNVDRAFTIENIRHPTMRRGLPAPPFILHGSSLSQETQGWWDAISLRDGESRVIECLRHVSPVVRINLVTHPMDRTKRMFIVRLENFDEPVPLKSLGDGVARMFQIAVAIEFAALGKKDRELSLFQDRVSAGPEAGALVLLLDEIENGIHYTVLPALWNFVFQMAKLHEVQVFATSHSWDCIEAFQAAATADPGCGGVLIRLESKGEKTRAVIFEEHELGVITRNEIEVR